MRLRAAGIEADGFTERIRGGAGEPGLAEGDAEGITSHRVVRVGGHRRAQGLQRSHHVALRKKREAALAPARRAGRRGGVRGQDGGGG